MSTERELVFERIRSALATRRERVPAPDYGDGVAVSRGGLAGRSLVELFAERLASVRGRSFRATGELASFLRSERALKGYCDPELWPLLKASFGGDFTVETSFARERVDSYAFGITRAIGGIAETGSVIIDDRSTSRRLAALAPWIHVAVLKTRDIHPDLMAALATLDDDPNVVWITGPSKTADVEGILIEGVHGPGEQAILLI